MESEVRYHIPSSAHLNIHLEVLAIVPKHVLYARSGPILHLHAKIVGFGRSVYKSKLAQGIRHVGSCIVAADKPRLCCLCRWCEDMVVITISTACLAFN